MSETTRAADARATAQPVLDALAATAWTLEPPTPRGLRHLMRDEAGILLDGLAVRLARGLGALDVAIGEGLAALSVGDRSLRIGYSSVGDYALDKLGLKASTAEKMARLAARLRERPLLREAVRRGEVSTRKAEIVAPVAIGGDEAAWVERAKTDTVRALRAAVRYARAAASTVSGSDVSIAATEAEDEPWDRVFVQLTPEGRAKLDQAMDLAGKVIGETAPKWKKLEAICEEFLGAHAEEMREGEGTLLRTPCEWLEAAKEALEAEMDRWSFLEKVEFLPAPESDAEGKTDPLGIDRTLRQLSSMRQRWDEVFGHVAMLLRMTGVWRDMRFVSFGHYCEERLDMGERTVGQRIWLERRLWELPSLRTAMREREISYEKARLVARAAVDDGSVGAWIELASGMPCIELEREIEDETEKQACARAEMDLRMPRRVADLVDAAFAAARRTETRFLTPGECLERLADHFIETWKSLPKERNTLQKRILARDHWRCQVPGCSRMATHVHHVEFRSAGGSDDPENLVSVCAAHHLHGIHAEYTRVRGRAPDTLVWEVRLKPRRVELLA